MFNAFSFCYLFNRKLSLIRFLLFFRTVSSPLWLLIIYVHSTVFFKFVTAKFSADQFRTYTFAKASLYFDVLAKMVILNLGVFIINLFTRVNICVFFTSTYFILIVLCYAFLYISMSSNLSRYSFFGIEVMYL